MYKYSFQIPTAEGKTAVFHGTCEVRYTRSDDFDGFSAITVFKDGIEIPASQIATPIYMRWISLHITEANVTPIVDAGRAHVRTVESLNGISVQTFQAL